MFAPEVLIVNIPAEPPTPTVTLPPLDAILTLLVPLLIDAPPPPATVVQLNTLHYYHL